MTFDNLFDVIRINYCLSNGTWRPKKKKKFLILHWRMSLQIQVTMLYLSPLLSYQNCANYLNYNDSRIWMGSTYEALPCHILINGKQKTHLKKKKKFFFKSFCHESLLFAKNLESQKDNMKATLPGYGWRLLYLMKF